MKNTTDAFVEAMLDGSGMYAEYSTDIFHQCEVADSNLEAAFWAKKLSNIEELVEDALVDDTVPFVEIAGDPYSRRYDASHIAKRHFGNLMFMLQAARMLRPIYAYNERLNVFISACRSLDLLEHVAEWESEIHNASGTRRLSQQERSAGAHEAFNRLALLIRMIWRSENLGKKYQKRRFDAGVRFAEYLDYERALFADCSRLLVLRVDLYYSKEFAAGVSPGGAINDLNRMFRNKRHNRLFRHLNGYIAKLEYGITKGLHWHLILFFDGSKRENFSRVLLVQLIGEYWRDKITKGKGDYWNVNAKEKSFLQRGILGIGVINADDLDLRENLRYYVIGYLCKIDQFMRPIGCDGLRLIRKGNFPIVRPKKIGRPRTRHLQVRTAKQQWRDRKIPKRSSSINAAAYDHLADRLHL